MKVYLKSSDIIKSALAENVKNIEFVEKAEADKVIDNLPSGRFKIQELINLINSQTKRSFSIGNVEISIDKKSASFNGKQVGLTEKEVSLLEFLSNSEKEISKEDILEGVWGYSPDTNTRTVETHLHRLNHKFTKEFGFKIIESSNHGYRIGNF